MIENHTPQTRDNPWTAFEGTPEAADLKQLKARVMLTIRRYIREQGWNQTQAAEVFGVKQPRISDLVTGKMHKFTFDSLIEMAVQGGLPVKVEVGESATERAREEAPVPVSFGEAIANARGEYAIIQRRPTSTQRVSVTAANLLPRTIVAGTKRRTRRTF